MNKLQYLKVDGWWMLLHIIVIVVVCEFIYWVTVDIIYSTTMIDLGFGLIFHAMPAILALALSTLWILLFDKLSNLMRNILLVLIIAYLSVSLMGGPGYCDEEMNLSFHYSDKVVFLHSGVVVLLLLTTGYFLIFKILSKMTGPHILVATLATFIFLVDCLYFLIGYEIFYPGYW